MSVSNPSYSEPRRLLFLPLYLNLLLNRFSQGGDSTFELISGPIFFFFCSFNLGYDDGANCEIGLVVDLMTIIIQNRHLWTYYIGRQIYHGLEEARWTSTTNGSLRLSGDPSPGVAHLWLPCTKPNQVV
ncbi:hypothetical protein GGU10DRAFT_73785 [Lentinula aff. detonsa]|uniref:Uncharacterized protein n=1 Tax=Lentinula aff. detonsa TaxID=2804958 RepID=A0AA38KUU6_9AGAR|nr:hypothetical protein GGU10DRAFT_73785 [Lentinula aff. detonsa]